MNQNKLLPTYDLKHNLYEDIFCQRAAAGCI